MSSGIIGLLCVGFSGALLGGATIVPPDISVAQNLQTEASVRLSQPAPESGVEVRLESRDPNRLLFAANEKAAGSASITLRVLGGRISTPEFYVHGLASTGSGDYTLTVSGESPVTGSVKLTRSAIILSGPAKLGNPLFTTSGSPPSIVNAYSVQLDESGAVVRTQQVRGDLSAAIAITSSDPKVASVTPARLTISGGDFRAITQFQPLTAGTTLLAIEAPPGFEPHSKYATLAATVAVPGLAITDQITIGKDLQTHGSLLLGEAAPPGGITATLTSSDPARLLLADSHTSAGSKSLTINIPAGQTSGSYFLQALGGTGTVTYSATAAGYRDRTATITLAPSGFVLTGPEGPPDEIEVLRPEAPVGPHSHLSSLSETAPSAVRIYPVYLDPRTSRGADITVQPVRSGLSIKIGLKNSAPDIGQASSFVTITGGLDQAIAEFRPLKTGTTILSLETPEGFTKPSNATTLTVLVTQ